MEETDGEVQGVITDYFTDLFRAGEASEELMKREKVCTVLEEQNTEILGPVSKEEVHMAIFAM